MTQTIAWRRVALAVFALAAMASLLYTIGAPYEQGG
jgi:hypothetical protein